MLDGCPAHRKGLRRAVTGLRPTAGKQGKRWGPVMAWLIWAGAGVSLIGLAGLIACIVAVTRAKRAGLDDAALRAKLQRVVVWNMGALFVSVIGLMMVVTGILLG